MSNFNNYHITFTYFGEQYDIDVIAFDQGITYPNCLTIYPKDGLRIVADMFSVKDLKIEPIK